MSPTACGHVLHLLLASVLVMALPADLRAEEEPGAVERLAPSWKDQATAAYGRKDWIEAIHLYRKWLEADPQDEMSWYNLACTYALAGEKAQALSALERAVDAGWKDAAWPKEDPDLMTVRGDARFAAALERAASRGDDDAPTSFERHHVKIPAIGTYVAMLPPDYAEGDADYPLVVILHGNGSTETQHGRLADSLGREGVIYVAPRAPYPNHGVFTGMERPGWTWRPEDASDEELGDLDPAGLYVASILAAVDDARARYRIRGEKIYVLGHSMGAFFAITTAALHPRRVASFFAYAGGIAPELQPFLPGLKEYGVRAYLAHGKADAVVSVALTEKAHEDLHALGVDVTTHLFDDQDHGIGPFVREAMRTWVDEVVRKVRAAAPETVDTPPAD